MEARFSEQDRIFGADAFDFGCDAAGGEALARPVEEPGAGRVHAADLGEIENGALGFGAGRNERLGAALDGARGLDGPVAGKAQAHRVLRTLAGKARRGRDGGGGGGGGQKLIPMPRLPPLSNPIGGFL